MKPTILVTGGAGYIGSHIAFLVAQKGYNVIILDSLINGPCNAPSWTTLIVADYADKEVLNQIFTTNEVQAVIHCAAFAQVAESMVKPLEYYNNNVIKTITLLEVMRSHGVNKIIFSSSCAIFGVPQNIPIDEDQPKNPISPYGTSKLMTELVLRDLATTWDLRFVALRYFNAAGALPEYGLGENHTPETHIIPLLIRAGLTKSPFSIFGTTHPTPDGTCIRDYLHVVDIATAHLKALEHLNKGRPSDVFNLGTGTGASVKQIIQEFESISGITIKTILREKRAGDPPVLVADPTKAFTLLEWKPQNSGLQAILKSAYVFACQNQLKHPEKLMDTRI